MGNTFITYEIPLKRIFLHLKTTPLEALEEHLVNTSNLNSKREIVLDIYTDMMNLQRAENETEKKGRNVMLVV